MGANLARRLKDCGYNITAVLDVNTQAAADLAAELGCTACTRLADVTAAADVITPGRVLLPPGNFELGAIIAAATLGASPTTVLWRVSLPLVAPAVASGAALAFARALGEFGATLTFAGSLQGTTRTLPLEIYLLRESESDLALALSVVLLAVAGLVVWLATHFRAWGNNG